MSFLKLFRDSKIPALAIASLLSAGPATAAIFDTQSETTSTYQERPNRFAVRLDSLETSAVTLLGLPLAAITGDVNLGHGFEIGPIGAWAPGRGIGGITAGFWSIGLQGAYYFSGKALQDGWFLRGFYNYSTAWISSSRSNGAPYAGGSIGIHGIGGVIGYHWLWRSGFNLSLGIGAAGYITGLIFVQGTVSDPKSGTIFRTEVDFPQYGGKSIILPVPELTMGWAF